MYIYFIINFFHFYYFFYFSYSSNIGLSSYVNKDNLVINQNLIMSHQSSSVETTNMLPKIRQLTKDIVINNSNSHINENIIDTNTEDSNKETILDDIYKTPMYFGTENSTVITTQIGATAHIPCTIHHIGDGVVNIILLIFFFIFFFPYFYFLFF